MAKPAVTVTLVFFFIALSYAFTPLDLPESDVHPSIHLPTEKHDSDPVTADITDPKSIESHTIQTRDDLPSSQIYIVDRVTLTRPATFVSFRPINRHFNVQRQFGLRLPLHRCSHHKKAMHLQYHGREVPYGNDMILADGGSHSDLDHHHHRYHDRNGLPEFPFEHHGFGKDKYNTQFKKQENGFANKIRKFLNHF